MRARTTTSPRSSTCRCPSSEEEGRAWVAAQHELIDAGRGWAFAIVDRETGVAVGGAGIVFRHPPGAAEPGVWVVAESRNRGIAEPWNLASHRVLEKVGFVREGLLRSYSSWRGSRQDVFLYSLLPGDLDD